MPDLLREDYPWYVYSYEVTNLNLAGITSIGSEAFEGFSALSSVNIPDGVEKINSSAFAFCFSLETITIPESVTYIEYDAFENTNISEVNVPCTWDKSIYDFDKYILNKYHIDEDEYGRQKNVEIIPLTVPGETEITVFITKDFNLGKGDKVMIFDIINGLVPLCEEFVVE